MRLGTADAETILKRFTRDNLQHPTYQALVEPGKAIKTAFLCRYVHAEDVRYDVHDGLNVVKNWNSANDFMFYGRSGEIATNRLDDQEIAVLSSHLLQACLVYINTLMLQQVLDAPRWLEKMTPEDYRGLTPLIYHHVTPFGLFELDMTKRLNNRCENSHRPTRERERRMQRFKAPGHAQRFLSAYGPIAQHFRPWAISFRRLNIVRTCGNASRRGGRSPARTWRRKGRVRCRLTTSTPGDRLAVS